MSSQLKLDWNRAARLRIVERCQLVGISPRARLRVKSLLRVIESHCREHEACMLSAQTIATEMGSCRRTALRSIAEAEANLLIEVERVSHQASTYKLAWPILLDLCQDSLTDDSWLQLLAAWDQRQAGRRGDTSAAGGVTLNARGVTFSHGGVTFSHRGGDIYAPKSPLSPNESQLSARGDTSLEKKPDKPQACPVCAGDGCDRCQGYTHAVPRGLSRDEQLAALRSRR